MPDTQGSSLHNMDVVWAPQRLIIENEWHRNEAKRTTTTWEVILGHNKINILIRLDAVWLCYAKTFMGINVNLVIDIDAH